MTSTSDVLVIGAGPAGLSAALVLGRARRRVMAVDAGAPRNAAAPTMQGFLSRDGYPPDELLEIGRREVAVSPSPVRSSRTTSPVTSSTP